MSDVRALLARCRELGAEFTPSPDGKLKVRAPAPLPEELQEQLRQRKAEVLALLSQQPLFPCPVCGGVVRLGPAVPRELPSRFWTCIQCGTWGGTRDGAVVPAVWVSSGTLH